MRSEEKHEPSSRERWPDMLLLRTGNGSRIRYQNGLKVPVLSKLCSTCSQLTWMALTGGCSSPMQGSTMMAPPSLGRRTVFLWLTTHFAQAASKQTPRTISSSVLEEGHLRMSPHPCRIRHYQRAPAFLSGTPVRSRSTSSVTGRYGQPGCTCKLR